MGWGPTVEPFNAYLNHKQAALDAEQLSPRTFKNYKETAELLVAQFGKGRLVAERKRAIRV